MDPDFIERHWDALPNLKRLRNRGHFARLATTMPPQSPVAWSSFITGSRPAEHGIFDFVHRDPATLEPYSSISRTEAPRFVLSLGPYRLPLSRTRIVSLRRGTPFWQMLAERGIPVTVMRMPTNYPPGEAGFAVSGMGTPDLRGTQGTFTFYTDDVEEITRSVPGGNIIAVRPNRGHVVLTLEGPPNTLRKEQKPASVRIVVDIDPEQSVARLQIGETLVVLKQGEWSDWLAADFTFVPHLASVRGIFRVFAKQLHPGFELYVSAVQTDPLSPALPVSTPARWSARLAEATGRFFTLGIPEDTAALRQKVFTRADFKQQTRLIFQDERKLLRYSLANSPGGLLFFYISVIDQSSHMLWRRYEPDLLEFYRGVDAVIGEVCRAAPNAGLVVMSDHGFTSFERSVHLNAWLRHRGFLTLYGPPRDNSTLGDLNWSKTEAYALGLNGLYLNRQGREAHGILPSGEQAEALLANLRQQLLAWRDPQNGGQIITAAAAVYPSSINRKTAPDLIIGYAPGYRASWQTGVGATPAADLEENRDAWIGDHCVDPAFVPGVLFTTFAIPKDKRNIRDLPSLILRWFEQNKKGS